MKFALLILTARIAIAGCIAVDHDRITAADLAGTFPELASIPANTVFGFSPLPGAKRNLLASDIESFAQRNQVSVSAAPVCVEYKTYELSATEITPALVQTIGRERQINVVDFSKVAVPSGEIVFARDLMSPTATAGVFLCRGFVIYGQNRKLPIWVRAQVSENGALLKSLKAPDQEVIRAGDSVDIEVRNGVTVLRLSAKAVSPAKQGQVVRLRNSETGKTFLAQAIAEKTALVDLAKGVRR